MRFSVHGPFDLPSTRPVTAMTKQDKDEFWDKVGTVGKKSLRYGCGCYVFVIRKTTNAKPWYVGMAAQQCFKDEVFQGHKLNKYNNAIDEALPKKNYTVKPQLYLLAKLTPKNKLSTPSLNPQKDIEFLEQFLIAMGLDANENLTNSKNTKFLKRMQVPGLLNNRCGKPAGPVSSLKAVLRI